MKRTVTIVLLISMLTALLSWLWYTQQIKAPLQFRQQQELEHQQQEVATLLSDSSFINYFTSANRIQYPTEIEIFIQYSTTLETRPFAFFLFKNDELLYWNKSSLLPDPLSTEEYTLDQGLQATVYYFPVKETDTTPPLILPLSLTLALLCIWIGCHQFILKSTVFVPKLALLILLPLLLNKLMLWIAPLYCGDILYKNSIIGPYGVNLLLQSSLFTWVMWHFYTFFIQKKINSPFAKAWIVSRFASVIFLLLLIIFICKKVVLESIPIFEFYSLLEFSGPVLIVCISICFLLAGLYLFSHTLLAAPVQQDFSTHQRLFLLLLTLLICAPVIAVMQLGFPLIGLLLLSFTFVVFFDLYLDTPLKSLTWLLFWLMILAAFSAGVLYKYMLDRLLLSELTATYQLASGYLKPLSLFAFIFLLLLIAVLLLSVINQRLQLVPQGLNFPNLQELSLNNRIQFAVISLVTLSFITMIGLSARYFTQQQRQNFEQSVVQRTAPLIKQAFSSDLQINTTAMDSLGQLWKDNYGLTSHWFDWQGKNIPSDNDRLPYSTFETLRQRTTAYIFQARPQKQAYSITYSLPDRGPLYLTLSIPESWIPTNELNDFMGSLMSVYVFFLFIAVGVAIWIANSITRPISEIGEQLQFLQPDQNLLLEWDRNDEIGLLVQQYNQALQQLSERTRQLRRSERESAWREMARQVAHEIKNPLTPMKLSLQHLQRAYQIAPDRAGPLVERVSQTLVEQIDSLTNIANSFSNFAQMPRAQLVQLDVNALVDTVVGLFREEVPVRLQLHDSPLPVRADREQLMRVIQNLLKNAKQAIPAGRQPVLKVYTRRENEQVVIQVSDNGSGIPEAIQEKVFYPNFTTKSSGMGLGLAMCKQMVEQFDGTIYFTTEEGTGSSFFVVVPLSATNKEE